MQVSSRVAFITGGASGMGAATAKRLAEAGARIILLDANEKQVQQTAKQIDAVAFIGDVRDSASIENIVADAIKQFDRIDILVNCAGVAPAARMVGREGPQPLDDFQRVIDINLVGTFNVTRLVATHMTQQKAYDDSERGVIINTASVAAYEGQVGQAAYSASKGGIVGMTLPLARELSQFGVRVMTIAPGIIATPMMSGMPEDVQTGLANSVPFPRRLGDPDEYAKLAEHIIENNYLNGSVIRLDAALRLGMTVK